MRQANLQAVYRPLSELHKLDGNPRTIKGKAFKTLCQSIRENPDYFEARPLILSNRTGQLVIIAGNQRFEAALHEKLKEVPTVLLEGLTYEREKEIIVRDNVNNGDWDFDALANGDWDVDLLTEWGVDLKFDTSKPQEDLADRSTESDEYKQRFELVVECTGEGMQAELYDKLTAEGYKCRILSM